MTEKNLTYLFISEDSKAEKYITDDEGFLKEKTCNLYLNGIGHDTRLLRLETAIYEKIKIHHRLDRDQVRLVEPIANILKELITNNRITIYFDASGRPREHVFFEKEDSETHFSWNHITDSACKALKLKIENTINGSLSNCNEIYIAERLFTQNSVFHLLKNELGDKKIVTDVSSFERRSKEFQAFPIYSEAEIEQIKFTQLQKMWAQYDLKINEKLTATEQFIQRYPNSPNHHRIEAKLLSLQDENAWDKANYSKTIQAYLDYLMHFKKGSFETEAKEGILNIESDYKSEIEPLKHQLLIATTDIEELDISNQQYKRKSRYLWVAVFVAALGSGIGSYFILKNKTTQQTHGVANVIENPLRKRVDELVENRIYVKQQQLLNENTDTKTPRSTDEMLEVLKIQENLNKALFDIHKVKFELFPRLDSNKISINEVEKEIIKIENQIK
jgi:hypothetical protein